MKTAKKFLVFSLFMAAGLVFAGCGDTAKKDAGSTTGGSGDATEEKAEGSDSTSSTTNPGEFQLVSLNVPNMT